MDANSDILPPHLARKISPWTINTAQIAGPVGKAAFIAVSILLLYGSVGPGMSDHNGFVYLLGPWVFPTLIALLWLTVLAIFPFRAYRGNPFAKHTYPADDPAVARLNALFNSAEARRHVWCESLRLSCILFAILGIAALLLRGSLNWTLPSQQNHFLLDQPIGQPGSWFWGSVLGSFWTMFMIITPGYVRWNLKTWAERECAGES